MKITKETVTPKKAMEWLKRNVHNRPISQRQVNNYAATMEAGKWQLNGDTIRFNGNGDLIDGQHRLHACVQCGKAFECYVASGLDHDAFDTIDQGRKRTTGDVFARQGYKHYITLASAARNLWKYQNGYQNKTGQFRPDMANQLLEEHPALHAAVERACNLSAKQGLIHGGILSFLVYATSCVDEAGSEKFWSQVMTGEGLTKNMPAYWLRERLINNRGAVAKLDGDTIVALSIKAWNSFRAGKPLKVLKWMSEEEFPAIQ